MPSYQSGRFARAGEIGAVSVQGFAGLQAALRRMEGGVQAQLRARLRVIGEQVALVAAGNVPHKTGLHGEGPRIEDSLKVSTTVRGAAVYTLAPQGGVQNVGGGPKAGWQARGPHVTRASASHYMDRAVRQTEPWVEKEVNSLLDWLMTTFVEG